jgi:hypothetical protein
MSSKLGRIPATTDGDGFSGGREGAGGMMPALVRGGSGGKLTGGRELFVRGDDG